MKAGKLNRKVTIEQRAVAASDDGGQSESWKVVSAGVWASIEPLRGTERHAAGGSHGEVDTRIRLRYKSGLKREMRVIYKKRVFDIQSVIDIRTDRRETHLMCKEYVDD